MLVLILGQQGLGAFLFTHGISLKAEPDFALMAQAWDTIQAEDMLTMPRSSRRK